MRANSIWTIATAVILLLIAAKGFAYAGIEVRDGAQVGSNGQNLAGQQQSPTEAIPPLSEDAAITPGTIYTVKKGDTMGTISRRAYGDSKYWQAICTLNAISDCGRIEIGDTLTIPTRIQADSILAGTLTPEPPQIRTTSPEETVSLTTTPASTVSFPLTSFPDGTWLVGDEINAGVYTSPGGEKCSWKRLRGFSGTSDDIIAEGLGVDRPIVQIAESDTGFSTKDCGRWTSLELPSTLAPTPTLTFTSLPAATPAPPTASAVGIPLVTVPKGWPRVVNDRLEYSFAVPSGWLTFDLQSGQLSQIMRTVSPNAAEQVDAALKEPGGEYAGHIAVELDLTSGQPISALAGVGAVPLADHIPQKSVVKWLEEVLESFPSDQLELHSVKAGTTNNLPSIQGVATVDLSSQGLFDGRAVMTMLRANDTAYILVILTKSIDTRDRRDLVDAIVGTFRPAGSVSSAIGSTNPTPTSTPMPSPTPTLTHTPAPTATSTPIPIVVFTRKMNIRGGPGTNYSVVGTASAGEQFSITGRDVSGDWWQIRYKGRSGWVYAPFVESEGGDSVRVVAPPPTATRTRTPTPRPTATRTRTPTPRPTVPPLRPGTYRVGIEIPPGIYIGLAGQGIWNSCYWERLKDLKGTLGSILANENVEGLFYVEILPSDKAFSTDCVVRPIGQVPPPSDFFESLPPGMYLVGRDIAPGLYKGQASRGDWCYWERLSSARGDLRSIIANENAEGQFFVRVVPSDFAVRFNCPVERVE